MEFALTEEQLMIRESAEGFLAAKSDSAAVRVAMATELGYDSALWQSVCEEMFWHAVHIPEQYGGLGLGYVEVAVVMEQMGRRLLCSPYFATVCLGANALLLAGSDAQKAKWCAEIVDGKTATLAFSGGGRDWSGQSVTAQFQRSDDTFELNGEYHYVVDGHSAEILVVAAQDSESGDLALFVLSADTAGVQRQWSPTMDQTRKLATVSLDSVQLGVENKLEGCDLEGILDLARIALAAEQCGGAQAVLEQSVAYVQEREQFGRTIASFQSIKHKAADMSLQAEVARSAVYYGACVAQEALAGSDGDTLVAAELSEAASMAKAYCSDAYFFNAGCGLQMHGGVGFTWEYDVHLYFKRAKSSESLLGDGAWNRERLAQQLLGEVTAS